ncbi:STAS domain-containing protein [Rubellicoccus peritrichatus]|uniref:STAS domain-containing protein n=1 Tax=Rubellicoccus peritrichatus TaxID=3080537 RepID=A0AAQ3L667_9BACT|nr:STAS domain-containing protein [Puniceicoccus sp. CR14]WOO39791.1 STAS domain-containing protein [Puniceicoccus sp. CR14]
MTLPMFGFTKSDTTLRIKINSDKFDASVVDEFTTKVEAHWQSDIKSVSVDVSSLEYIDSSGIGALLALSRRLSNSAEAVCLENPRASVVEILEMLRLHRVFKIEHEV